jgi:hypothetical protein
MRRQSGGARCRVIPANDKFNPLIVEASRDSEKLA